MEYPMSVHFKVDKPTRRGYDGADRHTVRQVLSNQPACAPNALGDVLGTTEGGQRLIAEAKAFQAKQAEERAAAQQAIAAEKEARRAKASQDADMLKELTLALAQSTGARWPLGIPDRRFQALSWGTMVDKLALWLRHASCDPRAYEMAFEAIYGEPMRGCPPGVVYRNARAR
jgi:hypothetical protein